MTNEELVQKIKEGQPNLINDLWTQIERFVRSYTIKLYNTWYDRCQSMGLEPDDLYQASALVLNSAIKYFSLDKGTKFLTVYTYFLRTQFYKEIKVNHSGNKCYIRPICDLSLDEPIYNDSDITLSALLVDDTAEYAYTSYEDYEFNNQLHSQLKLAMQVLNENEVLVIDKYYNSKMRMSDIARLLNITRTHVYTIHRRALNKLKLSNTLNLFYECL